MFFTDSALFLTERFLIKNTYIKNIYTNPLYTEHDFKIEESILLKSK